jgi:hypothetical protein
MAKQQRAEQQPEPAAPPMPAPDHHHWKTGPADVPMPASQDSRPASRPRQRAVPQPAPDPSAAHRSWRTSDGGPPVPDDAYEPPEPIRGVSN